MSPPFDLKLYWMYLYHLATVPDIYLLYILCTTEHSAWPEVGVRPSLLQRCYKKKTMPGYLTGKSGHLFKPLWNLWGLLLWMVKICVSTAFILSSFLACSSSIVQSKSTITTVYWRARFLTSTSHNRYSRRKTFQCFHPSPSSWVKSSELRLFRSIYIAWVSTASTRMKWNKWKKKLSFKD